MKKTEEIKQYKKAIEAVKKAKDNAENAEGIQLAIEILEKQKPKPRAMLTRNIYAEKIRPLVEQGYTDKEISASVGIGVHHIWRWRIENGYFKQKIKGRKQTTIERIVKREIEAGKTDKEIAEATGYNPYTIKLTREQLGLKKNKHRDK